MSISAINAKNQIHGKVRQIHAGEIVSEIELETPAGLITSVITSSSLKELGLREGQEAVAVVKATEVALARP